MSAKFDIDDDGQTISKFTDHNDWDAILDYLYFVENKNFNGNHDHSELPFGTHPAGQHSLDSESFDHLEAFDEEFQHLNCLDRPLTIDERQVLDVGNVEPIRVQTNQFMSPMAFDSPLTFVSPQVHLERDTMNKLSNPELGSQVQGMLHVLVGPAATSFDFCVAIEENAALGDLKRRFNSPSNVSLLLAPEVPTLLRKSICTSSGLGLTGGPSNERDLGYSQFNRLYDFTRYG